ncbi:DUF4384 domain-containing protein [Bradyrhizobium sp. ISRA443]|uniref:DUF4384 domain-containing protein n=1 Tax=unclassified Bradyrhizobium TaxID=2631580 RepID=UPI00247889E4|nr:MULTISPECIES: DUF4384 domain-containing protein [unclassified Bradyrhizobium]WGR92602.1 DUF4384 domain-containing protein [Bradyrhizobium sp. ISRA435]WGR97031.1 DUF4384 domain-containing protein [Bradyrhizobium sp. ISRA436]WGS03918.1 DUF4384 domain-containing protein [Bradyrhizobium sp. ISRA437]WGS10802.1 DUF4384 domain-containing protein [Bradyrhizobium sp. ISRA443]
MPTLQPIHHERSWLAFLLLVGSGAASAAPLPAASLHVNTTNAPWLWPVQAARGQTNAASISLEILPSQTVSVGGKVSFGVTARKRGYLILVDVDAEGRMSQIFPTPELLAQADGRDINLVRPGVEFVIPTPATRQRGFEYVVAPPTGAALMVAILSERRVQLLDLPDLPRKLQGQAEALSYLSAWTSELRVPDSGKLVTNNWSFDVKSYSIK